MVTMRWTELGGQQVEVSFARRDDGFILFKMSYDGALIMERLYDLDAADQLCESWGEVCSDWDGDFITPQEVEGSAEEINYLFDARWAPANWQPPATAAVAAPTVVL